MGKPVKDESYVNPGHRVFIRDNAQYVECEDASLHDLYIEAKYTGSTKEGGYGVNFVNAKDCTAYNIAGKGWTQLIGMGLTCHLRHLVTIVALRLICTSSNQTK